jgi:hypothetical protein
VCGVKMERPELMNKLLQAYAAEVQHRAVPQLESSLESLSVAALNPSPPRPECDSRITHVGCRAAGLQDCRGWPHMINRWRQACVAQ